jgi:hypothetical protein
VLHAAHHTRSRLTHTHTHTPSLTASHSHILTHLEPRVDHLAAQGADLLFAVNVPVIVGIVAIALRVMWCDWRAWWGRRLVVAGPALLLVPRPMFPWGWRAASLCNAAAVLPQYEHTCMPPPARRRCGGPHARCAVLRAAWQNARAQPGRGGTPAPASQTTGWQRTVACLHEHVHAARRGESVLVWPEHGDTPSAAGRLAREARFADQRCLADTGAP